MPDLPSSRYDRPGLDQLSKHLEGAVYSGGLWRDGRPVTSIGITPDYLRNVGSPVRSTPHDTETILTLLEDYGDEIQKLMAKLETIHEKVNQLVKEGE